MRKKIHCRIVLSIFSLLLVFTVSSALAQYVGEGWVVHQGLQGKPGVMKIGPNGGVDPNEIAGFEQPSGVAVNSKDGSFWVIDAAGLVVLKFQANGAIAFQFPQTFSEDTPSPLQVPEVISLNPNDGSAWIGNVDSAVKVSAEGQVVATVANLQESKVAVNVTDGSCWITSSDGRVGLYDTNGKLIANSAVKFTEPKGVATNSQDGSAWVADNQANLLVKLNKAGQEIARVTDIQLPVSPAIDSRDGSCWVIDTQNAVVIKLDANGKHLASTQPGALFAPVALAVDREGSVLVVDQMADPMTGLGAVIKISSSAQELWRQPGFISPTQIAVGCWTGQ